MTVHLMVGLPGAGKTTRAKELEVSEPALRLTPDDWHQAIFDAPGRWRTEERVDQRDRIEGKLMEIGMRAARLSADVVLDLGLWSRDERSALRWIAASHGVPTQVVYLPVGLEDQRLRLGHRFGSRPGHFEMSDAELERWRVRFEAPDPEELRGGSIPPVPPEYATWAQWAAARWPSWAG